MSPKAIRINFQDGDVGCINFVHKTSKCNFKDVASYDWTTYFDADHDNSSTFYKQRLLFDGLLCFWVN